MTATRPRSIAQLRPLRIVERNGIIARHYWLNSVARLFEPFLFLFSIGVGVGALVEDVIGPTGEPVSYRSFVAPAMVATSAMNAAVFASTVDFYSKLKWVRSYESMLATPLTVGDIIRGERGWILGLSAIQSSAFVLAMLGFGLIESWWAVLLVPTALLVSYAFAGVGFVAASFLRTWLDFDYIQLATVPLFLFSASFFPIDRYPDAVAAVVRLVPLYQGVDLARDLTFGTVGWSSLLSVAYLMIMGRAGIAIADRRLLRTLKP